jgi:hypothetical protein
LFDGKAVSLFIVRNRLLSRSQDDGRDVGVAPRVAHG